MKSISNPCEKCVKRFLACHDKCKKISGLRKNKKRNYQENKSKYKAK